MAGRSPDEDWLSDPLAFDWVRRTVAEFATQFDILRPDGTIPAAQHHPEDHVRQLFLIIADRSSGHAWSEWSASVRSNLGPAASQRLAKRLDQPFGTWAKNLTIDFAGENPGVRNRDERHGLLLEKLALEFLSLPELNPATRARFKKAMARLRTGFRGEKTS